MILASWKSKTVQPLEYVGFLGFFLFVAETSSKPRAQNGGLLKLRAGIGREAETSGFLGGELALG